MSVYISSLPVYTGTAADLRWFIMNNSGETTTFKYSGYSSPYKWNSSTSGVTEVNYTKSTQFNLLGGANTETAGSYSNFIVGTGNTVGSSTKQYAVFGNNNTATGAGGVGTDIGCFIFGQNNSHASATGSGAMIVGAYNSVSGNWAGAFGVNMSVGGYYSFGGGNNNNISSTFGFSWGENNNLSGGQHHYSFGNNNDITAGNYQGIWGGSDNSINSSQNNNSIVGGSNNSFGTGVASTTITASYNNSNIQAANLSFIAGTQDNTITSMGYTYALVGGGYNTVNATNASAGNAMYSSYFCSDSTINDNSVIGSSNNWFSGSRNGTMSGYGKHNWITNSYSSTITNNGSSDVYEWFNKIDSSSGSTITTSKKSQILGGNDNTISGKTNVVMVGTSGRTADANYTTYVENLHTYRTPSTQVQPIVSGTTFTCNLNDGAKSQFFLTGTSTINITNVRDGASFIIKTQTDGNYTTTWTASGYTFVFEGGIKDPGNTTTDLFVFEVFGSVIYGNRRHNYS